MPGEPGGDFHMRKRWMVSFAIIATIAILLGGAGLYLIARTLHGGGTIGQIAAAALESSLGAPVRIARASFVLPNRLKFYDIVISEGVAGEGASRGAEGAGISRNGSADVAMAAMPNRPISPIFRVKEAEVEMDLLGFIFRRRQATAAIETISMTGAEVNVRRNSDRTWNLARLAQELKSRATVNDVDSLSSKVLIKDGIVKIEDMAGGKGKLSPVAEIRNINGFIVFDKGTVNIGDMSGTLSKGDAHLSAKGWIRQNDNTFSLDGTIDDIKVGDALNFLDFVGRLPAVEWLEGLHDQKIDAQVHASSNPNAKGISYSGEIALDASSFKKDAAVGLIPRLFQFTIGSGKDAQTVNVYIDELTGVNLSKLEFEGQLGSGAKSHSGASAAAPGWYRGTITLKDASVKARLVAPAFQDRLSCKVNGDLIFEAKDKTAPKFKGAVKLSNGISDLQVTGGKSGAVGGGNLKAQGALSGDINFDTDPQGILGFSGKLNITGWQASSTGLVKGLEKISGNLNGNISFDGKVNIGQAGKSATSGKQSYGAGLNLKYTGVMNFVNGEVVAKQIVDGLESLSGMWKGRVDYNGELKGHDSEGMAGQTRFSGTVQLLSGNLKFGNKDLGVESMAGKVSMDASFSGSTSGGPLSFDSKKVDYKGKINLDDVDAILSGGPLASIGPISGKAGGEITFESRGGEMPKYKGAIELKEGSLSVPSILKEPVGNISATFRFDEFSLHIGQAIGVIGKSPVALAGDIFFGPRPRLELSLRSPALDISEIKAGGLIPGLTDLKGSLAVNFTAAGYLGSLVYSGAIKATNGKIRFSNLEKDITDINTSIILCGQELRIEDFSANVFGGKLLAKGKVVEPGRNPIIQVDASLTGVSPSEFPVGLMDPHRKAGASLPIEGAGDISVRLSGRLDSLSARGDFSFPSINICDGRLTALKGKILYDDGALSIQDISANIAKGTIRGGLVADLDLGSNSGHKGLRELTATTAWEGLHLEGLSPFFKQLDARLPGKVAVNWSRIGGNLYGKAVVSWKHGSISSVGSLSARSFDFDGFRFDAVRTNFRLQGASLYLSDFVAVNKEANLAAAGVIDLARPAIDMDISGKGLDLGTIAPALGFSGSETTGITSLSGKVSGPFDNMKYEGIVKVERGKLLGNGFEDLSGFVVAGLDGITLDDCRLSAAGIYRASGKIGKEGMNLSVVVQKADVKRLLQISKTSFDAGGWANGRVTIKGKINDPEVSGQLEFGDLILAKQRMGSASLDFTLARGLMTIRRLTLGIAGGTLVASGRAMMGKNIDMDVGLEGADAGETLKLIALYSGLARPFDIISGKIRFQGKVEGAWNDPVVSGALSMNGMKLERSDLQSVSGLISASRRYIEFSPVDVADGSGTVRVTGRVNLVGKKGMDLKVDIAGIDISTVSGVLAVRYLDPIAGKLNGSAVVKGSMSEPSFSLSIASDKVTMEGSDLGKLLLQAAGDGKTVSLKSLKIHQGKGYLSAHGSYNPKGAVEISLVTRSFDLKSAVGAMGMRHNVTGLLNLDAIITGLARSPVATISGNLVNGSIDRLYFDNISGNCKYQGGRFTIEKATLKHGAHSASISGTLPIPEKYLEALGISPPSRPGALDLGVTMSKADLNLLGLLTDEIEWARGIADVSARIEGDLRAPMLFGQITLNGGEIKIRPIADAITDIAADIEFRGNEVMVRSVRGKIRAGGISCQGRIGLAQFKLSAVDLSLAANQLPVIADSIATSVTGSVRVHGPAKLPVASGKIRLNKAEINPFTLKTSGKIAGNLGLDLELDFGNNGRLLSKEIDVLFGGSIHVRGALQEPQATGTLYAHRGSFVYFGTEFNLTDGRADFSEGNGIVPNIEVHGETRVDHTRVMLALTGRPDSLRMRFSSDPPMQEDEIMALLNYPSAVTRVLKGDVEGAIKDEILRIIDQELRLQVVGSMERALRQALALDEVKLERNEEDKFTLRLGKYVDEHLFVSYSAPLSPDTLGKLKLEYLVSPGVVLSGQFEGEDRYSVGLEARLKF